MFVHHLLPYSAASLSASNIAPMPFSRSFHLTASSLLSGQHGQGSCPGLSLLYAGPSISAKNGGTGIPRFSLMVLTILQVSHQTWCFSHTTGSCSFPAERVTVDMLPPGPEPYLSPGSAGVRFWGGKCRILNTECSMSKGRHGDGPHTSAFIIQCSSFYGFALPATYVVTTPPPGPGAYRIPDSTSRPSRTPDSRRS